MFRKCCLLVRPSIRLSVLLCVSKFKDFLSYACIFLLHVLELRVTSEHFKSHTPFSCGHMLLASWLFGWSHHSSASELRAGTNHRMFIQEFASWFFVPWLWEWSCGWRWVERRRSLNECHKLS